MRSRIPVHRLGRGFAVAAAASVMVAALAPGAAAATTTSNRANVPCNLEFYPVGGNTVHGYPAAYQAWLTCASPVQMMNLKIERTRKFKGPDVVEIVANKKRNQVAGPIELRFDLRCEHHVMSLWQAVAVIKDTPTSPKRTIRSPQKYTNFECGFYMTPPGVS